MNRVKESLEDRGRPSQPEAGSYFVVNARCDTFYVSPETAARLGRALDRRWRPRWLKFVDVTGARVWLHAAQVESISESTETQRSNDRAFHHARRKEDAADRRWDEEEY